MCCDDATHVDSELSRCHIHCMTAKASHPKRPRDANELAKSVVDLATRDPDELVASTQGDRVKDEAAVSLGRRGGLKGGVARARKLNAKERQDIAAKAARTRWGRKDGDG